MDVLFEKDIEGGKIHGFTGNYIRVAVDYSPDLANRILPVTLLEIGATGIMQGEIIRSKVAAV